MVRREKNYCFDIKHSPELTEVSFSDVSSESSGTGEATEAACDLNSST